MEQEMTIQDIEFQFAGEWILVADPETDAGLHVLKGRVICHSKDRDEVYRYLVANRPTNSAMLYTGELPENTAVVL